MRKFQKILEMGHLKMKNINLKRKHNNKEQLAKRTGQYPLSMIFSSLIKIRQKIVIAQMIILIPFD